MPASSPLKLCVNQRARWTRIHGDEALIAE
jgi:hypothetical protein